MIGWDFLSMCVQALLWLAYFSVHSLLASRGTKDLFAARLPHWMPYYRAAYNAFAFLSLLPVVWFAHRYSGPMLWAWKYPWNWLSDALALAALACFVLSFRCYDMRAFLGLPPRETFTDGGQERFRISPFHRYVRHPWYAFGLVLLWTRDMSAAMFVAAIVTTGYLFVGSWLEEEKLLAQYGEAYRRYRERVAGLIPLPWKWIFAQEAADLIQDGKPANKQHCL